MDLIVRGGQCFMPGGSFCADIGIAGGRIAALAADLPTAGARIIDARQRWVFPGGIDVHCHLPWPSGEVLSGDDIQSGTRAAAAGGVTTVLDFVIPELGEDLLSALERKLAQTRQGLYADYSAHIAIREVTETNLDQIPTLVARGFNSFKVFMAYEGFRLEDGDILRVMDAVRAAGGIVSVHAENGLLADRATRRLVERGEVSPAHYAQSRPACCEHEAIARIIHYAAAVGVPLHIHHVSTAAGARAIGAARARGQHLSAETCPQYLLFNDEVYRQSGVEATYLVIAPPLRKAEDQAALWQALATDDISLLATDHCPYSLAQKRAGAADFTRAPGGTGGVETRWPLAFTEGVVAGRLTPERLAAVWALNPARAFGLYPRKAGLAVGADADLIIVDPAQESTLSAARLHMNSDISPYEGRRVRGFPLMTILRGQVVAREGEPVGEPLGQVVARSRPLPVGGYGAPGALV
jgi:dihydropyrimidinase